MLATDFGHLPNLMAQLAGAPRVPEPDKRRAAARCFPFVDLDTLPQPLREAVHHIRERGVSIGVRCIASDIPLPVFQCVIHEPGGPRLSLTHSGSGAHPDAAVAARRAITEAVQSRATFIHGVREDLRDPALRMQDPPPAEWFVPGTKRIAFSTLPSHVCDDIVADLRFIIRALATAGLAHVFAADLSHQDVPFKVVRVIVPGLEAPLDFRDRQRVALGWRARRIFAGRTGGGTQ
jgi:YcaO-like protein with predicted kinase domain